VYFYVYHFARQKSQGKFERLLQLIVLYFAVKRDNWRTDFSQNSFLAGPALNPVLWSSFHSTLILVRARKFIARFTDCKNGKSHVRDTILPNRGLESAEL